MDNFFLFMSESSLNSQASDVLGYPKTQKPETRGKTPTYLEPEPENQNPSQTRNPTIKLL